MPDLRTRPIRPGSSTTLPSVAFAPRPFAHDTYTAWHQSQFPDDEPLLDRVEHFRNELIQNSRGNIASLAQILAYTVNYPRREFRVATGSETEYRVTFSDALLAKTESSSYHLPFKPSSSIINKRLEEEPIRSHRASGQRQRAYHGPGVNRHLGNDAQQRGVSRESHERLVRHHPRTRSQGHVR